MTTSGSENLRGLYCKICGFTDCTYLDRSKITGYATSYNPGQIICLYGYSTGFHYATLLEYDYEFIVLETAVTIEGLCLYDAMSSSNQTSDGDSGGPVYYNTNGSGNYFLGTITGEVGNISGTVHYGVFSPIGYALSEGFTPKTN